MVLGRSQIPLLVYGATVLVLVACVAVWARQITVDIAEQGWQQRARASASLVAATADLEGELSARLARMAVLDPDTSAISLLRVTDEPGKLRVIADWSRSGGNQPAGEVIDAAGMPDLLAGLHEPTVTVAAGIVTGYAPLEDANGRQVGVVGVRMDANALEMIRARSKAATLAVVGLVALGVGLLTMLLARMADPIEVARRRTTEWRQPPLPQPIESAFGPRVELMTRGQQEREFIRDTFGRYVSHKLAETLLEDHAAMVLVGEEREATLLRAELDGYAVLASTPGDMLAVLNDFLAAMVEEIDRHGGFVVEWCGDSLLAAFGAPVLQPDHAERAVRCAIAMRTRLDDLLVAWEKNGRAGTWQGGGVPNIRMRMALHSGRVVAGHIGSARRIKYGVVGGAVDLTAALGVLNDELGTDILVTESVVTAVPEGTIRAQERGTRQITGQDVRLYSL